MIPVPRIWPGATVAILAGGPSLTAGQAEDVARAGARTIAVKDAIRIAPWAGVLYGGDAKWWGHHGPSLSAYAGPRYGIEPYSPTPDPARWGVAVLRNTGQVGLETDPSGLRTGKNSGYQAVNLAVHLGAARIVLLGFDMQPDGQDRHHWFGAHPYRTADPPYRDFREMFKTIVEPLQALGIEVLNATPGSALDSFPRVALADALQAAA
ncbi:MAG: hypothetical protein V4597_08630 [Pseudomonadota bacterium]